MSLDNRERVSRGRGRGRLSLFVLFVLFVTAMAVWPAPVAASVPMAVYVVPTKVEMLPTDANASHVVIHGAFMLLTPTGLDLTVYTAPRCGSMYFQCAVGDETMCRMQWQDLRKGIGGTKCLGFGAQGVMTSAVLRSEGAPLETPDPWELGVGVQEAGSLSGMCPIALSTVCPPQGSGDGGVQVDASATGGAAATGGASGSPGATGATGGTHGGGGEAATAGASGSGGASRSGGAPATGGIAASSSGGAAGSGGSSGSGAASGSSTVPPAKRGGGGCTVVAGGAGRNRFAVAAPFIVMGWLLGIGWRRRRETRRSGPGR